MELVQHERFVALLKELFYRERSDVLAVWPAPAEVGSSIDMVIKRATESEVFG
jgi:hypothetical protein